MTKVKQGRRQETLQPIDPKVRPFQKISMDINKMPYTTTRGNTCVLVVTDYLTKWVEAFPLPDEQVETILPCVLDVICRHGCPEEILTDQGANFESNLFKALCRDLGISKQRSAAYFPQCNGLVERMNRVINNMLSAFDSFGKGEWDILLPQILFAYRVKNHIWRYIIENL